MTMTSGQVVGPAWKRIITAQVNRNAYGTNDMDMFQDLAVRPLPRGTRGKPDGP